MLETERDYQGLATRFHNTGGRIDTRGAALRTKIAEEEERGCGYANYCFCLEELTLSDRPCAASPDRMLSAEF